MNPFQQVFAANQAFVAYLTAGQNSLDYTYQAALELVAAGVNILEIGVPFSDPVADGPSIQAAMDEALNNGVNLDSVLATVQKIKAKVNVPIVLFSYYNPLYAMGMQNVLRKAKLSGVDGILIVDLPLEASSEYYQACAEHAIEPVCIISPTSSPERVQALSAQCNSFLYYVCRNGITGVKNSLPEDYRERIQELKQLSSKPVVSGFGIGNRQLASAALAGADGFVVGSAFVNAISAGASVQQLGDLAREIDSRGQT